MLICFGQVAGFLFRHVSGSQGQSNKDIDEEARRKRERESEGEFLDPQLEETPVPTELAVPSQQQRGEKLELSDLMALMHKSMTDNTSRFDRLDKETAATKREAHESKVLAAKATTIATETQGKLEALEKRVAQLEKSPSPIAGPPGLHPRNVYTSPTEGQRDWDMLGGELGDTIVVGGFRAWADKSERREEWDKLQPQIPEELQAKVKEVIIPNSPGSIALVKIHPEGSTRETRVAMFAWVKKFKETKAELTFPGESVARTFYATPSKPFQMRQRDAKVSQLLDGLKLVAGPEKKKLQA